MGGRWAGRLDGWMAGWMAQAVLFVVMLDGWPAVPPSLPLCFSVLPFPLLLHPSFSASVFVGYC